MTRYAHIDDADFPLVVVTFTGEKATEDNFAAYLDELSALYDHEEPFILVFDATDASLPGLKYQRRQAQWMAEHYSRTKEWCLGAAYVIPQDLIRTVLKAIFALQQPAAPYEIFATYEAGMAWARSRVISV